MNFGYCLKICLEHSSRERYIVVCMKDNQPWEVCYCYSKTIAKRLVDLLNKSEYDVISGKPNNEYILEE